VSVEIKSINIRINQVDLVLTVEEALGLYESLEKLFSFQRPLVQPGWPAPNYTFASGSGGTDCSVKG
jgi:hypothetical protein